MFRELHRGGGSSFNVWDDQTGNIFSCPMEIASAHSICYIRVHSSSVSRNPLRKESIPVIISASRRTDIPSFYSDWLFRRLAEGYLYVKNPMNPNQVSEILLNQDTVDCFVFWTKDPGPMMEKLSILDRLGYPYYFQFTLTPYGRDVEPGLRGKEDLVRTFRELSKRLGPERVIWRYDPILLSPVYTREFHYEWFSRLCGGLEGYTDTCVISFLDMYQKIRKNMKTIETSAITRDDMAALAGFMGHAAKGYGISVRTCSEEVCLDEFGIQKGRCIDDRLITRLVQSPLDVKKDDTQREACGCVKSVDIGAYHTCGHGCRYCYANFSQAQAEANLRLHDPGSPLLLGRLTGKERITVRDMRSVICRRDEGQMEINWDQME